MRRWREFEEAARPWLSNKLGIILKEQHFSQSRRTRADAFGIEPGMPTERHVAEFKFCTIADKSHVDQVARYAGHPRYAKHKHIVYPENCEISKSVRIRATEKRVNIHLLDGFRKQKERRPGLLGLFKPKQYLR